MNSLLDEDTEDDLDDRPVRARDREITLGTTVVLGIFFALAAYGAVLFGFGYSMGVKHLTSTPAASAESNSATFSGFKPPPGSPLAASNSIANRPANGAAVTVPDSTASINPAPVKPAPLPKPVAVTAGPVNVPPAPVPVARTVPAPPPPVAVTQPVAAAAPGAAGSFLVQVAAVSHQEDADLLIVTLKRRGYPVVVRHEPQDSLLHVQIGNFTTKKDADAMRQRLLADGFNAIVK